MGHKGGKTWEQGIVSGALKELRKEWGSGWESLGEDLRKALLSHKVLCVIARQDHTGYPIESTARLADTLINLAAFTLGTDV